MARPPTFPLLRLLSSAADITVKLRNRGPDAYKTQVYGDSITVEQRLSCDGSRTCKLKSKSGVCHESQAPDEHAAVHLPALDKLAHLHFYVLAAASLPCAVRPSVNVNISRVFTFRQGLMFFTACKCH